MFSPRIDPQPPGPTRSRARTRGRAPIAVVMLGLVLALGLAACGSSTSTSTPTKTASTQIATMPATTPAGPTSSVTSGPVHATFTAHDHAPKVKVLWPFSVHVTDTSGKPLSGSVRIEFTLAGAVVGADTPPVHPVKNGHWQEKLTFPSAAVGEPLSVQAVVHTTAGSVTLDWPIKVVK